MPLDTGADGMTKAMGMDPLRRDMIAGAVIGFLLIAATFAIFIAGLRQINEARDAQESLDHASRYVQATLRGVGELILAEGASAQVKAFTTTQIPYLTTAAVKGIDAADLAALTAHLEHTQSHFAATCERQAWDLKERLDGELQDVRRHLREIEERLQEAQR